MKKLFLLPVLLIFCAGTGFKFQSTAKVSVAAAANMRPALDSIVKLFRKQDPASDVQVIYGSSGKFYEQIVNGAPFDVFFSADMNYPAKLRDNLYTSAPVKLYAIGQIAIWSKKFDPNIQKMNSLIDPSVKKIAIANPAAAPYGAKAVESLKYYKLYDKLKSELVYGESVAQAAQFVAFGAADAGVIALSECLSPNMKKEGGHYWIIPEESHGALEQGCVVLKHGKGNADAKSFYDFISSEQAKAVLMYYGYSLPVK